jgi:NitT/TauT family transport system ATP-binding protein
MPPPEQPPALLRMQGVAKTYARRGTDVPAVDGVDLAVREGEFLTLLGPSGCGKSTLLMMMAGLEMPSRGAITFDGTPMRGPRRDIGIVFQDATLLPWQTALGNVLFPLHILRQRVAAHRDRAIRLLDSVGLAGAHDRKPGELSGGMRQRVAICRALIHEPRLLLMDEPFSALDAITRDQMNLLLADLLERQRRTVVFVTHSIREAAFLSDRILVLGGRPSGVMADVVVPFGRGRTLDLGETAEFNALCRSLRGTVDRAHRSTEQAA